MIEQLGKIYAAAPHKSRSGEQRSGNARETVVRIGGRACIGLEPAGGSEHTGRRRGDDRRERPVRRDERGTA